jgi:tRNA A64-2'-O-ribosylphosphate transferase
MKNLSKAIDFAKRNLLAGRKILVCCQNGKKKKTVVSSAFLALRIRTPYAFLHYILQLIEP